MKRVWRVRPKGEKAWLTGERLADVVDSIEAESDLGGQFELECVEMAEEDFAALGEFDGW